MLPLTSQVGPHAQRVAPPARAGSCRSLFNVHGRRGCPTAVCAASSKRSTGGGGEAQKQQRKQQLTPYQGKSRCFGAFRCEECQRTWLSGNSWANCGQQCQGCYNLIYPYMQSLRVQTPLKKAALTSEIDQSKPHPEELCEKCQQLGYSCRRKLDWLVESASGDDD